MYPGHFSKRIGIREPSDLRGGPRERKARKIPSSLSKKPAADGLSRSHHRLSQDRAPLAQPNVRKGLDTSASRQLAYRASRVRLRLPLGNSTTRARVDNRFD
jgi:hypothetical protein